MKKRILTALAVLLAMTLVLASCNGGGKQQSKGVAEIVQAANPEKLPENAKSRKDTLIVGTVAPKGNFNPIYSSSVYDSWVVSLVFGDTLIGTDEKGLPVKTGLAKDWTISEDGKTYTFTLNEGIKFSDGTELTAEDVAFTYTAICDPSYSGPRFDAVAEIVGSKEYREDKENKITKVEGITVKSKYVIEFKLKDVKAPAIYDLGGYPIMPKAIYGAEKGKIEDKAKELFGKPVGAGPYLFKEHKPGQEVSFEANPNYYEGAPKIKNVIMKVTNAQTAIQELSTGSVDIDRIAAKPENIEPLKAAGFINLNIYPANSYGYIGVNMRLDKFKDKKVRQALVYGLNRKGFVDNYYKGYASVCNAPVSPVSWAYTDDVNKYEYDAAKANSLLEEAGWVKKEDGFRYKDGQKFTIKWMTYTGSKYVEQLTPILQQNYKDLGIDVQVELMEFETLATKVYDEQNFEMYNMAWSLSIDPDPIGIFGKDQLEKGGFNSVGWDNDKSFELMDKGLRTTNQDERKKVYNEWVKLASDEVPYIFVNIGKDMYASSCRVKNLIVGPYQDWTFDIHKIEISEK